MKLSELKAIGEKRTPGEWVTYPVYGDGYGEVFGPKVGGDDRISLASQADATFIAYAANHWDKLIAVAEAAKAFEHAFWERELEASERTCRAISRSRENLILALGELEK